MFPVVVLVQGSGPSNMDEKVGNNYPFKDLAEGLSKKRIAVLHHGKRTFIHGKKMREDIGLTVREESIEDVQGLNHMFMPAVYGEILEMKKEYKVPQHVD